VHLGCTREEQLRWFVSAWNAAQEARKSEIEVVGVTAWALFGSFDWDSLLTRDEGHYEPGIFDVRGHEPRPTALAHLVRQLIRGRSPQSPVLDFPGWWQRSQRLLFRAEAPAAADRQFEEPPNGTDQRPLLVWSSGKVAGAISRICGERGLDHRVCSGPPNECDAEGVAEIMDRVKPWAMIYAESSVPNGHRQSEGCPLQASTRGQELAAEAARRDLPLLVFCLEAMDARTLSANQEHAYRGLRGCSVYATGNARLSGDSWALCMCKKQPTLTESAQFQSLERPARTTIEAAPVPDVAALVPDLSALISITLDLLIDRHSSA
jgi:dTDP-4-dehydrorhamnose reductase